MSKKNKKRQDLAESAHHFEENRRRFLQQGLVGLGALASFPLAGSALSRAFKNAEASTAGRRHLINIIQSGGRDTQHFYNVIPGWEATKNSDWSSRFSPRVPLGSEASVLKPHPRDSRAFMNYGMNELFTTADYQKLSLWLGMRASGGHDIGNGIIQHGAVSVYAISYSGLIADALGRARPRPLNYVQVESSPAALYTNMNMTRGFQIPINIPNDASFRGLTTPTTSTLLNATPIERAIEELAGIASSSSFKRKASAGFFDTFLNSFRGASSVAASRMADSREFRAIWGRYTVIACDTLRDFLQNCDASVANVTDGDTGAVNNYTYLRLMHASTLTKLNSFSFASLPQVRGRYDIDSILSDGALTNALIADLNRSSDSVFTRVKDAAFGIAMADYLVRYDLSNVIELRLPCEDYHNNNRPEIYTSAISMTLMRELLRSLSAAPLPGGRSGETLFDRTTVVGHTEFDREALLTSLDRAAPAGTDHGEATSIIVAGGGVKNGRVFGGVKTNTGTVGTGNSGFGSIAFNQALPVNLNTGEPDPSGSIVAIESIAPTILSLFGLVPPADQIGENKAIPFIKA